MSTRAMLDQDRRPAICRPAATGSRLHGRAATAPADDVETLRELVALLRRARVRAIRPSRSLDRGT